MKPVVALDLSLFAVPSTADTSDEVQEILARIRAWASLVDRQNCVTFATISNAIDALREANCYPATHNLRALLQLHQLEHVFSPNDLNTRIFSMLQKSKPLSDAIGVEVIEVDEIVIEKSDVSKSPDLAISKAWACLLASVAICGVSEIVRASTAFDSDPEVPIAAHIRMVYRDNSVVEISQKMSGSVYVVEWPADYLNSMAAEDVWKHAEDSVQLHLSVSMEACRIASMNCSKLPANGLPDFSIGSDFLASLKSHGALGSGTLANVVRMKCAQSLVSKSQAAAKEFGEVRSNDMARSHRVHLSKDHEAFRLMYWSCQSGAIEFANIGVKHELIIEEGDHQKSVRAEFA